MPSEKRYIVAMTTEESETVYWNNTWGWSSLEDADIFSEQEHKYFLLPMGGKWVLYPPK